MLILIGLIVLSAVFTFWAIKNDWDHPGIVIPAATFLTLLALATILILPIYVGTSAEIEEFNAIKVSMHNAREHKNDLEVAAVQLKVFETNQWLAKVKFYNKHFSLWIPEKVMELEPIK